MVCPGVLPTAGRAHGEAAGLSCGAELATEPAVMLGDLESFIWGVLCIKAVVHICHHSLYWIDD